MSATGAAAELNLTLTPEQAAALLPVEASEIRVEFLRPSNHSWRITADGSTYFLKVHTKDWYGGVPAPTVARHEASSYRLLAEHGLATPALVYDQLSSDNPLGWPYLIVSELDGTSLTELLDDADQHEADDALHKIGTYLARMHAITFRYPGYLVDGAPKAPPRPDGWQHGIWRYQRMLGQAIQTWAEDAKLIGPAVMDEIMTLLADKIDDLRRSFHPPRFTHGDCHAGQFFLTETAAGPTRVRCRRPGGRVGRLPAGRSRQVHDRNGRPVPYPPPVVEPADRRLRADRFRSAPTLATRQRPHQLRLPRPQLMAGQPGPDRPAYRGRPRLGGTLRPGRDRLNAVRNRGTKITTSRTQPWQPRRGWF
ncbi:MAG: aminoglycoside phosphotransferase family protein [Microlunatus sp.]|nr:aminoglycoside phosphotransferase family protein [Microlunatus sp.]